MNSNSVSRFIINHVTKSSGNRHYSKSNEPSRSSIQVCLLGGHTPIGCTTAFLLKQNSIISKLKVQGDKLVTNLALDLNQIDTKCVVEAFPHVNDVAKALWGADIVLILPNQSWSVTTPLVTRVLGESQRIYQITKECTEQAPRALIVVAVPPVSVFTPLVANVFKKSHFYHPSRILGSASMAQVKINSIIGRFQDFDPYICQVPIVGGPDVDLAVPLFSSAKPVQIDTKTAITLMAKFRQVHVDSFPKKHYRPNFIEDNHLSEAYALNNMITVLGLGIFGDPNAFYNAFVRMNLIPTCQYLVTTLQFFKGGVAHNCGLPPLSSFELDMLERAVLEIRERERMAEELMEYCEGKSKSPPFEIKEKEKTKVLAQLVIK